MGTGTVNAKITAPGFVDAPEKRAQKVGSVRQSKNQYDIMGSLLHQYRWLVHLVSA